MSIFFKARSGKLSSSVGLLLIRLSLGFIFLFAGAEKVLNLQDFITSIQEKGQMDNSLAFILAFVLPFMEMIFGALYIIGLFTPVTSFFLAMMTVSFILVLGPGHEELAYSHNFVFLACEIATMFMGAGLISFDAFMDREKTDRNITVTQHTVVKETEFSPAVNENNFKDNEVKEKEVKVTLGDSEIKKDTDKE
ncbi:MAG: DoxX family protein [Ignavibacteria bacterium]|nr:DoxX family protein [Ignavibacteria bacterium]